MQPNISGHFKLGSVEANSEKRHLWKSDLLESIPWKNCREVRQGREGSEARVRYQSPIEDINFSLILQGSSGGNVGYTLRVVPIQSLVKGCP